LVGNELSPAAGWEYLQNLPAEDRDTVQGFQRELKEYIMPKLYSTQPTTYTPYTPNDVFHSQRTSVKRTLYVQYAPNGTFATVQHIPIAFALKNARLPQLDRNKQARANIASIEMPQAYTSVFCELNAIRGEADTRPIVFPNTYIARGDEESESWLNGADVINYTAVTRRQIWDETKQRP